MLAYYCLGFDTKIKFRINRQSSFVAFLVILNCLASIPAQAMENRFLFRTRQLTSHAGQTGEGYFSTDGQQLIFQSEREVDNPLSQIYTLNLKTNEYHRVSNGKGKATCAFFHPTDNRILFASSHQDSPSTQDQGTAAKLQSSFWERKYSSVYDENMEIYTANRFGQDLRCLTDHLGYDAQGAYSPNGEHIVFCSFRSAYPISQLSEENQKRFKVNPSYFGEIYLMRQDGSKVQRLTYQPGYDGGPFFAPDGKKIIWQRFDDEGLTSDIFTMDLDGTNQQRVTHFESVSWAPYFHPSGEYVIFASNKLNFSNFELFLVDTKGQHQPVRVTYNQRFDGLPVFSPDGNKLCWTSNRTKNGESQLFLADWNHRSARQALLNSTKEPSYSCQPNITESDLKSQVKFLASDNLAGRMTGTAGTQKAAEYISEYLKQIGLQPISDSFLQPFEFTSGIKVAPSDNFFELHLANSVDQLTTGISYQPLSFTANRTVSGEVVFAGYGLLAPQEGFNSYQGLDVRGKIVLVFRYAPNSVSIERRQQLDQYMSLPYKAMVAREQGAKALLVATGPISPDSGALVPLEFDTNLTSGIVSVSINGQVANHMFALAGKNTKSVQQQIDAERPSAATHFEIPGLRVKISTNVDRIIGMDQNIVGLLPGQIDEYIMVGAHYDHIGKGDFRTLTKNEKEGEIHNGADDNASGTAAVLEIAHAMSGNQKRGILFSFWSGEELGFIGSTHFTENPLIDLSKIVAYINLDMVGKLRDDRLLLQGVGSSPHWTQLIKKHNDKADFQLTLSDNPYLPTDAVTFYTHKIPVINLFTGGHENYNRPEDDSETLNYGGLQRISQFSADIVSDLADSNARLPYTEVKGNLAFVSDLDILHIELGMIMNYIANDVVGIKVSIVRIDSPAEKAGIKNGDVIVELAGRRITHAYHYTYAVDSLKIGKEAAIVVNRGGKQISFRILPIAKK